MVEKFFEEVKKNLEVLKGKCGNAAHSTLTGVISLSWLKVDDGNKVKDGAPKVKGRVADLVLVGKNKSKIAVEVENTVKYFEQKVETLRRYINNGYQKGLLIATFEYRDNSKVKKLKEDLAEANQPIYLIVVKRKRGFISDYEIDF